MIICLSNEYINDVCSLGKILHDNFSNTYNFESLNEGVNKTFLYIIDNKVVGFIHIQIIDGEVDIIDLVVNPLYRRNGYASKLIDYVLTNYKESFILEVSENNNIAISLYKSFNFIEIGRRKNYYGNMFDAIIMERK